MPAVHDDLVRRRFVADAPDRLWLTDFTEHPTREGKVYCAAVLDVYSRRIVGWSIADHRSVRRSCTPTRGAQDEFKESSQHRLVGASIGDHQGPRQESSIRASCGGGC